MVLGGGIGLGDGEKLVFDGLCLEENFFILVTFSSESNFLYQIVSLS